jgi:hypothetical protein
VLTLPPPQTLGNGIKFHRAGTLKGASGKLQLTAEQMEISRLLGGVGACDDRARHPGKRDYIIRKGPEAKYAYISRHSRAWPIRAWCCVFGVSVSGYQQHLARHREIAQRRHLSDVASLVHISAIYAENGGT